MTRRLVYLIGLCCVVLSTGCEAQITAHVMATLTASAPTVAPTQAPPTGTPTVPLLPTDSPTPSGEPKNYVGTFTSGFEVIAFKPCNSDEVWWVNGERVPMADLYARYATLTKRMEPVHVQLRGLISERGAYGHMGGYAREFYVQEVLEVRAVQPDDCH